MEVAWRKGCSCILHVCIQSKKRVKYRSTSSLYFTSIGTKSYLGLEQDSGLVVWADFGEFGPVCCNGIGPPQGDPVYLRFRV